MVTILNRDGAPNVNLGLNFIGPCGTFRELPKVDSMGEIQYKYASELLNDKPKFIKNESGIWVPKQG